MFPLQTLEYMFLNNKIILYYQQRPITRYQVRFYANNYFVPAQRCVLYVRLDGRCREANECLKCFSIMLYKYLLSCLLSKLVCKPFEGHFEPLQIIQIRQRRRRFFIVATLYLYHPPFCLRADCLRA